MPTYAENAATRERASRKAAQDRFLGAQQHRFDAEAADRTDKRGGYKTMKYERPSFVVVTASEAFREGWERIFVKLHPDPIDPLDESTRVCEEAGK